MIDDLITPERFAKWPQTWQTAHGLWCAMGFIPIYWVSAEGLLVSTKPVLLIPHQFFHIFRDMLPNTMPGDDRLGTVDEHV